MSEADLTTGWAASAMPTAPAVDLESVPITGVAYPICFSPGPPQAYCTPLKGGLIFR